MPIPAIIGTSTTTISTAKSVIDSVGKLFGGETSDLEREIRYQYFDGHHDRVRDRLINKDFFRWAWYSGYWSTVSGQADIATVVGSGTVADAYIKLFYDPNKAEDVLAKQNGYFTFSAVSNKSSLKISPDGTVFFNSGSGSNLSNASMLPTNITNNSMLYIIGGSLIAFFIYKAVK